MRHSGSCHLVSPVVLAHLLQLTLPQLRVGVGGTLGCEPRGTGVKLLRSCVGEAWVGGRRSGCGDVSTLGQGRVWPHLV